MKIPTQTSKDTNLKIVDICSVGSDHKSIMRNLFSLFENSILIANGSYRFQKKNNHKDHERSGIKLFQTESSITSFPFISPNIISNQQDDDILIAGYKSVVNNTGDFSFFNTTNELVSWNSESDFIKLRTIDNTFLIDDEEMNSDKLHYTHLIFTRYLFNGLRAAHINYIVKKKGTNDHNVTAFIRAMNYIKQFVNKQKLFYFSVAGNANISSSKWQKIIYLVFKKSCYVSPGIESQFITDIDNKHGARASRFILVSKEMAPNGVYFYLTQQKIDYFSTSNILVAEILETKKHDINKNDDTKKIYNNFMRERRINPSLQIDLETTNDVILDGFNLNDIGMYKPINLKTLSVKTFSDI